MAVGDRTGAAPLICVECGRQAPPDARGWRAELADDPREDEPAEVAVYCFACWAREFGPREDRGP